MPIYPTLLVACFLLCAGGLILATRATRRLTTATIERGNQVLRQRVAPFAWIRQEVDNGPWHMAAIKRERWERLAGTHMALMPTWGTGIRRVLIISTLALGLVILAQWCQQHSAVGWAIAIGILGAAWIWRAIILFFRARLTAAQERLGQCEQVSQRPWVDAWQADHPGEQVPTEHMPDQIEAQAAILSRLIASPEYGDATERLDEIRQQLPPRIIQEIMRGMIWRLAQATPGGHTGRSLRMAINMGAPVDHHQHTRQTSIFYQNTPILTAFTGQHDGPRPVMFWIDTLRDVVEALGTSPGFDINALDPTTHRPALAELILAAEHYRHRAGRRSERSAQDVLEGIALLVDHGASINLALDTIEQGQWLSQQMAMDTLAHSGHPNIERHLAERQRVAMETRTPPAIGSARRGARL